MRSITSLPVLLLCLTALARAQDTCTGICLAEGESMLNEADYVEIINESATCGYFDTQNKAVTDPTECQENADAAAAAGCKCGVPIECAGICLVEGESMLNEAQDVDLDDQRATCGYFDSQNQQIIDAEVCAENAQKAEDAGCRCGVPIECAGICLVEGESMLNEAQDVDLDKGRASCGYFDSQNQQIIDAEVCAENAQKAQDAGCSCGVPINCPGICPEGETMTNEAEDVDIDNQRATCGYFDNQNQQIVDPDVCRENAANAKEAGCKCTGTFPPTAAPAPGTSSASLPKKMVSFLLVVLAIKAMAF